VRRSIKALESLRSGKAGLALFYGYLVAILVVGIVLFVANRNISESRDKIESQAHRQCVALSGAVSYWRSVRQAVMLRESDYTRSPEERRADATLHEALDRVIGKGAPLSCEEQG
jgi:hypothetical protein